ncbi:MAG TPA: hypothetical protein VGU44_04455 [Gammaproteobacteria bacterium]|nr:hypothetical protein [Gammaproteobacteria bacterium]
MNNRKREIKAETSSLNDICKGNDPHGTSQTPDKTLPPIVKKPQAVENIQLWEERFSFFALALKKEIAAWSTRNAVIDCFSYQARAVALERFSEGFDTFFNDLVCDWMKSSGFLVNGSEKFYLSKELNKLYAYVVKKYSFNLKEAIQIIKSEYAP